jgi:protein SCO1/2
MNFSPVKFWLGLLLAAVGVYGLYSGWRIYGRLNEAKAVARGVPAESPGPSINQQIGHFQLTERSGQTFDSDELKGQVWVASFFFADCPGACLKMNNSIAELQVELADKPVRFVSITVDPAKDTPERLREYAQHYQADASRWVFLTGEMNSIRDLAVDEFKVPFAQATHSDRLMIVDRQGRVRGTFRGTDPTQITLLKRKLAEVLGEEDGGA